MDKVDITFPKPAKAAPNNLPKNAAERADALLELMGRMTAHLRKESQAVANRCTAAELERLNREKQPMTLVYEEISRLLRVDREGMANLPVETKTRLRDATRALFEASAENAETMRRNSAGQKILVDTVVAAINRARQVSTTAYSASRAPGRSYGPPARGPATSATLNTRL